MTREVGDDPERVVVAKAALRREMRDRRSGLSAADTLRVGEAIAERIVSSEAFGRAETMALYAGTDGEPDLRPLFDAGRSARKHLLMPRCGPEHHLEFCRVASWTSLVPGRFGLLEPSEACPVADGADLDLVLAPAVAVDSLGTRLGRGGGWYDRFFFGRPSGRPVLIAAVHAFQVVDRVPRGALDRAVDGWVSELELRWTPS